MIIKFTTEVQEDRVEDLMSTGYTSYPDTTIWNKIWADDLMDRGIVTIIDGCMKLTVSPKDITVLDPSDKEVKYSTQKISTTVQ